MNRLEPLKLRPSLHPKVWGTVDLEPFFGRSERRIGEAWCVHDGSKVAEGPLEGRSVQSLVKAFGQRLMGPHWIRSEFYGADGLGPCLGIPRNSFPMVGKILFASERLSIQVHPDDRQAKRMDGGIGKSELWYVISASEGAELGLGTKRPMLPRVLASKAADGGIEDEIRWIPAEEGKCVYVPAGTVHSARGGVVLCEIQQNSHTTYRLFDYRRPGLDGGMRALQVGRAVEVASTTNQPSLREPFPNTSEPCKEDVLAKCPYFFADRLSWSKPFVYTPNPRRCEVFVFVRGHGSVNGVTFRPGDAFLVPAEATRFPVDGWEAEAIRAHLP